MRRKELTDVILNEDLQSEEVRNAFNELMPGFFEACLKVRDDGPTKNILLRSKDFGDDLESFVLLARAVQFAGRLGVINVVISLHDAPKGSIGKLISSKFLENMPVSA